MALDANALLFLQETLTQNDGADVKALRTTFTENGVASLDDFRKLSKDDLAEMKVPIGLRNRFLSAMTRLRPNNSIAPEGKAEPLPPAPAPVPAPVPAPAPPKPPKAQPVPQPQPKKPAVVAFQVNAANRWSCPACTAVCQAGEARCGTCGTAKPNAAKPVPAVALNKPAAAAAPADDDDDDPFAKWRNGGNGAGAAAPPQPHVDYGEPCEGDDIDEGAPMPPPVPHAAAAGIPRPLGGLPAGAPGALRPAHAVRR